MTRPRRRTGGGVIDENQSRILLAPDRVKFVLGSAILDTNGVADRESRDELGHVLERREEEHDIPCARTTTGVSAISPPIRRREPAPGFGSKRPPQPPDRAFSRGSSRAARRSKGLVSETRRRTTDGHSFG